MNPAKRLKKGKNHQVKSNFHDKWTVSEIIDVKLSSLHTSKEFSESISEAWSEKRPKSEENEVVNLNNICNVYKNPFSCCQLREFFKDEDFLHKLKEELLSLSFHEKSNDLYKFRQSEDLKKATTPSVSALKKFLYGEFREWISSVTGIQLNSTVDMSCARYDQTDVLLCHDDELEGRRIAYILYLVDEDWEKCDGGTLDLFAVDSENRPTSIVSSVIPQWNSFSFFAVTPSSFHQVSEVLAKDKCRLSVSGWFHGEPFSRPAPFIEPVKNLTKPIDMDEDEFYSWINPTYLNPMTQGDIQETFEDKSEIQLREFINPEKYQDLCRALNASDRNWILQGPVNKRNYEYTNDDSPIISEAKSFFQSEAFFLVLSNLTGLKLHRLASTPSSSDNESESENGGKSDAKSEKVSKEIDPCCRLQVSRWKAGSYTLLSDEDADACEYALDVWFFLSADNWQLDHGGQIAYIARDEDEELLTVCPSNNCLALVYRDQDTMRFVKHINSDSGNLRHFSLNGVYYDRHDSTS